MYLDFFVVVVEWKPSKSVEPLTVNKAVKLLHSTCTEEKNMVHCVHTQLCTYTHMEGVYEPFHYLYFQLFQVYPLHS